MGICESASTFIGISILLSDLMLQINETNFNLIKEMLRIGLVEDDNDYYNEEYQDIIDGDKLNGNYTDVKEYLEQRRIKSALRINILHGQ